jgi:uncharacterized protein (TIGR02145 family)
LAGDSGIKQNCGYGVIKYMKTIFCLLLLVTYGTISCNKDSGSNDTVKDIDGNVYHVVKIGTQVWMSENLRTGKYNDGTSIPLVTDDADWENLNSSGYCWYDNDSISYKNAYGALYNWNAVNTGKLAPEGWHIATDEDWTILVTYLGGDSVAGGKLKEKGTGHWAVPNTGATNESGFTAIPGGYRQTDGKFFEIGQSSNLWSSSNATNDNDYFRGIGYNFKSMTRGTYNKKCGFSVRCVMD